MNVARQIPWVMLGLCAAAVAVHLAGASIADALMLRRDSGGAAYLAQLWTAPLAHVSARHLLVNLSAGALALGWLERRSRGLLLATLLVAAPVSGLAVMQAMPEVARLAGLSCVLHGVVGSLAVHLALSVERRLGIALGLVLVVKLVVESLSGGSLFAGTLDTDAVVTTPGHVAGFLAGACVASAQWLFRRKSRLAGAAVQGETNEHEEMT